MAGRSTLDPDNFPGRRKRKTLKGHDTKALGPSDSSDSGSDMAAPDTDLNVGDVGMDDTSDRFGTGEHLTAGKEPKVRVNADRDADRVVRPEEAGLGGAGWIRPRKRAPALPTRRSGKVAQTLIRRAS